MPQKMKLTQLATLVMLVVLLSPCWVDQVEAAEFVINQLDHEIQPLIIDDIPQSFSTLDLIRESKGYYSVKLGKETLVIISAGEKPYIGHEIEISQIYSEEGVLMVVITEQVPQVVPSFKVSSHPYTIIKTSNHWEDIKVRTEEGQYLLNMDLNSQPAYLNKEQQKKVSTKFYLIRPLTTIWTINLE